MWFVVEGGGPPKRGPLSESTSATASPARPWFIPTLRNAGTTPRREHFTPSTSIVYRLDLIRSYLLLPSVCPSRSNPTHPCFAPCPRPHPKPQTELRNIGPRTHAVDRGHQARSDAAKCEPWSPRSPGAQPRAGEPDGTCILRRFRHRDSRPEFSQHVKCALQKFDLSC